jgi:hypothetical protein
MLARMEKDLADLDASLAASTSPGQYGLTAEETALGMQALQKVKESLGDLSVSNIGNVLAIGLAQTKALVGNPALLRPPRANAPAVRTADSRTPLNHRSRRLNLPYQAAKGRADSKAPKASLCMKSTFLSKAPEARKARGVKGREKGITKVTARARAAVIHNLVIATDVNRFITVPLARCVLCLRVATVCPRRRSSRTIT